jgi:hypothetical protein
MLAVPKIAGRYDFCSKRPSRCRVNEVELNTGRFNNRDVGRADTCGNCRSVCTDVQKPALEPATGLEE